MELHLLPKVPSFALRHQLQEGAMTRPSPRARSFDILLQLQEGAPRSASTRPSQVKAHLAHQGATRMMPRRLIAWPSFGTYLQALAKAQRKGRQGNKHVVANMRRSIRMTFGDTPPLKSVNVDMRRRRRQRRILWCPLVLPLQVRQQEFRGSPSPSCQSLTLALMRSWPTSTTSSRKAHVEAARSMATHVRTQPRRRPSQALLMIWHLHQVPQPHWPLYGTMKTSHATIAKAKTMTHANVPISCVQYEMEEVT